ncbi:hypothetical protein PanWU01x14_073470, partial [Parasponia andersonii]
EREKLARLYKDGRVEESLTQIRVLEKGDRGSFVSGGEVLVATVSTRLAHFHSKPSNRQLKNSITCLDDKYGIWRSDDADLLAVIVDYFGDVFLSNNPSNEDLEAATCHITSHLSYDDIAILD